jgi:hypothetical protein
MLSLLSPGACRAGTARGTLRASLVGVLLATAVGLATTMAAPAPAFAAVAPTITVPSTFEGFGRVAITGTARPGATVDLYEAAYTFRADLAKATEVYDPQDIITTVAGTDGTYRLSRLVDSGFVFAVQADGLMSAVLTVHVKVVAELQITTTKTSTVYAKVLASPGEPNLTARVQRKSGTAWTNVAEGKTANFGEYSVTLSGQPAGSQTYRAWISGDPVNALLESGWTPAAPVIVGSATAPGSAATGAVQLTKIQYDSPGTDTGSNTSINGEWVRLTNKTKKTINLRNWTVRDVAGHVYKFTTDHSLAAGKNVYVLTGKGTNGKPAGYRYWGSSGYIWNNSGDTATLKDPTSKTIDSCKWTKDNNTTYC